GCSQRAIAGNAHTPTIRVGAADPSHFCHHHPRGSGLDPGRHRPITGAGVQASARSAPDERIRSKHVSVRTVESQSVIGNAGYVRRAGYSGIMAVSGQKGENASGMALTPALRECAGALEAINLLFRRSSLLRAVLLGMALWLFEFPPSATAGDAIAYWTL